METSCPNLRGLQIELVDLEVMEKMTPAREAVVATLLEKYGCLETLRLYVDFNSTEISDPLVKAKLKFLKDFELETKARKYFRWETYSSPNKNM
ncbi:hypothetical protein HK102_008815 [Quaeritorhiza haematococci]|nr:hypothetical protein HK102_008815 [Quaeritorhiza haematococci]